MKTFYPVLPDHVQTFDTESLRSSFLIENLFAPGKARAVYALEDRMILFGAVPTAELLSLEIAGDVTGTEALLDRREIGIINLGATGTVVSGEDRFTLDSRDVLYLGRGSATPSLASERPEAPARFYAVSVPAHNTLSGAVVRRDEVEPVSIGSADNANHRKLYKCIHPDGINSCQLVMGYTQVQPGSVWNTMPPHTHLRRTEAYLYFDLPEDQVVMHFMGEGDHTQHLVVRNDQGILSPSWSLHAGAGTAPYAFVWAMAGENQDFGDMDHIAMSDLF
jgi:4-deoxy-L-threo-5-hexosulose-uronate ketol-isomerase